MKSALRVAVADDEADIREYFERLLPRLGHEVVASACNGVELVDACQRFCPDLIITDVRMPEMNGDEAVERIRRSTPIPVILISAYARPRERSRLPSQRCMYLNKPIRRSELEAAIVGILDNSQANGFAETGHE